MRMETRSRAKFRKRTLEFQESQREYAKRMKLDDDSIIRLTSRATPIDILNDDVMINIFSYLTIKDLITIERVSRKWRELSLASWANVKKLEFPTDISKEFPLKHVKDILKKGGRYLTHLKIDISRLTEGKVKPDVIFSDISKYCSNLTHLNLVLCFREANCSLLKNVARNLKLLWINLIGKVENYCELAFLVREAVYLEDFSVLYGFDSSILLNLTNRCKALSMNLSYDMNNEIAKKIFNNLCNLEHLDISWTSIQPESLQSISNQLKSFKASSYFFSGIDSYRNLQFSNLLNLDLSDVRHKGILHEGILHFFIKKSPMLEKLVLHPDCQLNTSDVDQLAKLEKLRCLDLSYHSTESETLKYLAQSLENLKEVCCFEPRRHSSAMIYFIKYCPNITTFTIGKSTKFNCKFLKLADRYVRERLNKISLTLKLKFEPKIIEDEIKRLELEPFDYEYTKGNRLKIVRYRFEGEKVKLNENDQAWSVRAYLESEIRENEEEEKSDSDV